MYLYLSLEMVLRLPSLLTVEALSFLPQLHLYGCIQLVYLGYGEAFGLARPLLIYKGFLCD